MSDFLGNLVARSLELAPVLEPRLASPFELPGAPAPGPSLPSPERVSARGETETIAPVTRHPGARPAAEGSVTTETGPPSEPSELERSPRRRKQASAAGEAVVTEVAVEDRSRDSNNSKGSKELKDREPRAGLVVPPSESLVPSKSSRPLEPSSPWNAAEERPLLRSLSQFPAVLSPREGRREESLLPVSSFPTSAAGEGKGTMGEGPPSPAAQEMRWSRLAAALAPAPLREAPPTLREVPPRRPKGDALGEPRGARGPHEKASALRPADPSPRSTPAQFSPGAVVAHPRAERTAPLPFAPPAPAPPTIQVTIGRIEVRATLPTVPSSPAKRSSAPAVMSLDEYLRRRDGERR